MTSKYPTACKDYDGSSIYSKYSCLQFAYPQRHGVLSNFKSFCSACHGINTTTSHFSTTTKATWDLWDLLSEKNEKVTWRWKKNRAFLAFQRTWCFCPIFFQQIAGGTENPQLFLQATFHYLLFWWLHQGEPTREHPQFQKHPMFPF